MIRFTQASVPRDFSRAAGSYDAAAQLQQSVRAECVERLRRLLDVHAEAELLDAGCGTGALAEQLAAAHAQWRVTGIDLAPAMCAVAKTRLQRVANADATALPFADASFGVAVSSLMLQWVNDPLKALREMRRVVKPGGYLVLTSFGPRTLQELSAAFAAVDAAPRVSAFAHRRATAALMQQAGWEVMDAQERIHISTHPSLAHLMEQLKSIGATNKRAERRRGLTARSVMEGAEREYVRLASHNGVLRCSWETYLFVLKHA